MFAYRALSQSFNFCRHLLVTPNTFSHSCVKAVMKTSNPNIPIRNFHLSDMLSNLNWLNKMEQRLMKNQGHMRTKKKRPSKMFNAPQMRGIVLRLLIRKPKKPNSANRRCCKVRLTNGKVVNAHIPGEGHSLQEHNMVLVEGTKKADLANVHHKVIRGKLDCAAVVKKVR